jgi:hypothetical protein
MDTDAIVGIIGIVVGVSGWAAFALQLKQNRNNKKSTIQNTLESLDQLAGRWIDRIAEIANSNDDYRAIAAKINYFNANQGGYEAEMRRHLNHLPRDHTFDDVRQGFKDFQDDAFDVKKGLIGDVADPARPPLREDEWKRRKNKAISGLRARCAKLQELLQRHIKDT